MNINICLIGVIFILESLESFCDKSFSKKCETKNNRLNLPDSSDTKTLEDRVRQQYESLPYPEMSDVTMIAEEEHYSKHKLPYVESQSIRLEKLNHYLYEGNYSFRNAFRVLVAGGGTGLSSIVFAEQLNQTNGETVYLDFSKPSTAIAQRRARARSLCNIVWILSWIEGIKFLGLGYFDNIESAGVLHHLKNPLLGLDVLKDVSHLKGGMDLMVYAKIGRTAVYMLQDLMKIINQSTYLIAKQLYYCKEILRDIPKHHWFLVNDLVNDHKSGDAGILDLLLHKRDVAYSVESLRGWIKRSGLFFVDYDECKGKHDLKIQAFDRTSHLTEYLSHKTKEQLESVSEIVNGHIIKHSFFTSKIKHSVASFDDPRNSLYTFMPVYELKKIISYRKSNYKHENAIYFNGLISEGTISADLSRPTCLVHPDFGAKNLVLHFKLNSVSEFIIQKLLILDSKIKLSTLYEEYKRKTKDEIAKHIFEDMANDFIHSISYTDIFLIRAKNTDRLKNLFSTHCYKLHSN